MKVTAAVEGLEKAIKQNARAAAGASRSEASARECLLCYQQIRFVQSV
jgi:hypothetical protein